MKETGQKKQLQKKGVRKIKEIKVEKYTGERHKTGKIAEVQREIMQDGRMKERTEEDLKEKRGWV
jgi:hypothetical protein